MSQVEEFVKIVEGVKDHDVKVVIVTGKPGSGKSKVLREAAEEKKWDYIDCRLLITEKFLEVPPGERQAKEAEMRAAKLFCWIVCKHCSYRWFILMSMLCCINLVRNL